MPRGLWSGAPTGPLPSATARTPTAAGCYPVGGGRYHARRKPLILPGQTVIFGTDYRYGNTAGKTQNPLEPSQPVTTRHLPAYQNLTAIRA